MIKLGLIWSVATVPFFVIDQGLNANGLRNSRRLKKELFRGAVVIATAQLHSTKSEPRFCAGSNSVHGMSEIRDNEDLRQWSQTEIRLNTFRRSTIPQTQFIIFIKIFLINPTLWKTFWKKH